LPGPQLENIPWWSKNILMGRKGANVRLGRAKYTKYKKIRN